MISRSTRKPANAPQQLRIAKESDEGRSRNRRKEQIRMMRIRRGWKRYMDKKITSMPVVTCGCRKSLTET